MNAYVKQSDILCLFQCFYSVLGAAKVLQKLREFLESLGIAALFIPPLLQFGDRLLFLPELLIARRGYLVRIALANIEREQILRCVGFPNGAVTVGLFRKFRRKAQVSKVISRILLHV